MSCELPFSSPSSISSRITFQRRGILKRTKQKFLSKESGLTPAQEWERSECTKKKKWMMNIFNISTTMESKVFQKCFRMFLWWCYPRNAFNSDFQKEGRLKIVPISQCFQRSLNGKTKGISCVFTKFASATMINVKFTRQCNGLVLALKIHSPKRTNKELFLLGKTCEP